MTSNRYLPGRVRVRAEMAAALLVALLLLPMNLFAGVANWSRDDAAHLLRRAGFGGTPAQIDRLFAMGREGAVDYLITGKTPQGIDAPFEHVEITSFVPQRQQNYRLQGPALQYDLEKMRAAWIDHMVRSDRPLEEKMTLFWHGLFTSGVIEVKNVSWLSDQHALLQREAIGNYKRLTHEIIHDSAMIKYLNNDENLKGRPNENLARELMELFTMGEGNGYAEKDIPEVARALTGMTPGRNGAEFVDRRHDDEAKTIFGKTGNFKPDDVVDLIFDRPEPATYLSKRLWTFFAMPDPSEQDIALVADALRKNNWDLAPALRTMFTSASFYSDQAKFTLIKSPVELEAMTLRLLEEPSHPRVLTAAAFILRQTGQELFQPPNVKGWPGGEHWITSTAIYVRYGIAAAMANGTIGANVGRGFRFGSTGPAGVARAGAATQPANLPPEVLNRLAARKQLQEQIAKDPRFAKIQAMREEQAKKVQEELAKIPPLPPVEEMIVPARLFAQVGKEPKATELVDAAVSRFLQRPLDAEKKAALVQSLGTEPLKLGEPQSDQRVRQMIAALLSTPEYQVE